MKKLFLFLFAVAVMGCDEKYESVDFLEPQPGESKNESGFNKKFRGTYNGEDGSKLFIYEDKIVKRKTQNILFGKEDIDSTFTGDTNNDEDLKAYFENEYLKVLKISGDSIYAQYQAIDTVFKISESQVCRSLKGSYFLNYKYGENNWKVQRLDLEKDRLSVSMIMPHDSLFKLLPVQEKAIIKNDSGKITSYQIKPTRKEFQKLIKDNAFEEREVWIKER
jgi:preprotein translocase subunit Sss1